MTLAMGNHAAIDRLIRGQLRQGALDIINNPGLARCTYIYIQGDPPYNYCWVCYHQRAYICTVRVVNYFHKHLLCINCFNRYRQLQEDIITPSVMNRRLRILAPQFVSLYQYDSVKCIVCCHRGGSYINNSAVFMCEQCKIAGTRLLCVEVLLVLSVISPVTDVAVGVVVDVAVGIIPDVRYSIVKLIWTTSIDEIQPPPQ